MVWLVGWLGGWLVGVFDAWWFGGKCLCGNSGVQCGV